MIKVVNFTGIIVGIIIVICGIIFLSSTDSYISINYTFTEDIDKNILMQLQQNNVNILKLNNSIHVGFWTLISSIGFLTFGYFINKCKN